MARAGELSYYFDSPEYEPSLLFWKEEKDKVETTKHLQFIIEKFRSATEKDFENSEEIKSLIFEYATEVGRGKVLWPLRVALSGKEKSPDPFTLLYVLGQKESLKRIATAVVKLTE